MLVVGRGVGQGRGIALYTVVGMTLGAGLIQLPLLAVGLSSLIGSSPLAFSVLRWLGAGYLVWLGLRLLIVDQPHAGFQASDRIRAIDAVREGMISNLLNPWSMGFMIAFLPQFVDASRGSVTLQLLLLGATQKATGAFVLGGYALAAGTVGQWIQQHPSIAVWQRRLAGCFIMGLGVRMALGGHGR